MKILHIFRTPVGGLFRHVCDLAAEQSARGHLVGALYDSSTADALTDARLDRLARSCALGLHGVGMSRALSLRDVAGLVSARRLAGTLAADVLHGHGAKGGAFARLAAALSTPGSHRPRAFYTPHGGSLHYDPASLEGRLFLGLERHLERWTDGLIFESAYSARVYEAKIGQIVAPAQIVPNGLQPDELQAIPPAADAADFLFVGELRLLKGVDLLLQALARLQSERRVTAVIVGDGPDAAKLHALAAELGLADRVRFTGALPARTAFPLGRSIVVPSRAESFPYIVLEAAAARIPLVASAVGGIPEIVAGTDTALIAPDDVAALTAAMLAHVRDREGRKSAAAALQASVATRFTVGRMTDGVLTFYEETRSLPAVLPATGAGVR